MGFSSFSLLPVVFTSFTAIRNAGKSAELTWTTANEINNHHYVVERSLNSADWNEIATVMPGNAAQANSYQYKDENSAAAATYYRIRQVDMDGKYMYSDIKVINAIAGNSNTSIFAANKNITIRLDSEIKNRIEVRVINMAGNIIQQRSFDSPSSVITFSAGYVSSGIYIVQVIDINGLIVVKKIVLS